MAEVSGIRVVIGHCHSIQYAIRSDADYEGCLALTKDLVCLDRSRRITTKSTSAKSAICFRRIADFRSTLNQKEVISTTRVGHSGSRIVDEKGERVGISANAVFVTTETGFLSDTNAVLLIGQMALIIIGEVEGSNGASGASMPLQASFRWPNRTVTGILSDFEFKSSVCGVGNETKCQGGTVSRTRSNFNINVLSCIGTTDGGNLRKSRGHLD